jgi:hypothetical protein
MSSLQPRPAEEAPAGSSAPVSNGQVRADFKHWAGSHLGELNHRARQSAKLLDPGRLESQSKRLRVDLNKASPNGHTALHNAARYGRAKNVQLILGHESTDPNQENGLTHKDPLEYALESGSLGTVMTLASDPRTRLSTHADQYRQLASAHLSDPMERAAALAAIGNVEQRSRGGALLGRLRTKNQRIAPPDTLPPIALEGPVEPPRSASPASFRSFRDKLHQDQAHAAQLREITKELAATGAADMFKMLGQLQDQRLKMAAEGALPETQLQIERKKSELSALRAEHEMDQRNLPELVKAVEDATLHLHSLDARSASGSRTSIELIAEFEGAAEAVDLAEDALMQADIRFKAFPAQHEVMVKTLQKLGERRSALEEAENALAVHSDKMDKMTSAIPDEVLKNLRQD